MHGHWLWSPLSEISTLPPSGGRSWQQLERAEQELWGPQQLEWLEQLELEHDNIRAALEWGRASGQSESMLRLAAALARFWDVRGFLTEGYGWLSAALDATASLHTISRAQGLARAGYLAVVRNDLSATDRHLADALALAQDLEDEESVGAALMVMGMAARARGEYQEAASKFEQSLEMSRRAGHRPGIYTSMYLLASAVRFSGDYQRAIALHEESLALKREHGDIWGIGASLFSLGSLARILGDHQRAQRLYRELADEGRADAAIAAALHVNRSTVERTRRRFVEWGLEAALSEQPRPGAVPVLDTRGDATVLGLACSNPPEGRTCWTMQLPADELVERLVVGANLSVAVAWSA